MEALPPVEGNAFELRDALVRLIHNAVDAMPQGGSLAIRGRAEASGWVVVEVTDTGVGMSVEQRRRLAEHAREPPAGPGLGQGSTRSTTSSSGTAARCRSIARSARGPRVRLRLHAEPLPDHPAFRRRWPSAQVTAGARRARRCWWTTTRGCSPCLGHAAQRGPRRHHRRPTARRPSRCSIRRAHDVVITDLGMPQDERLGGRRAHQDALARDRACSSSPAGARASRRTSPCQFVDRVIAKPVVRAKRCSISSPVLDAVPDVLARVTPPSRRRARPPPPCLLVRPGRACPVEVYMIRRQKSMRFLGGYYAFPGGKVEPTDAARERSRAATGCLRGRRARRVPAADGIPPLAFWVTAARELVEETGCSWRCDADGRPVDDADPAVRRPAWSSVASARSAGRRPSTRCWPARAGTSTSRPFRYLSHFITPPSSPIRFTARFFLAPVPAGQERAPASAREASEGFWIDPAEGHRRFTRGRDADGRAGRLGLAVPRRVRRSDDVWQRTPTAGTSSTASTTASTRPASAFPQASAVGPS